MTIRAIALHMLDGEQVGFTVGENDVKAIYGIDPAHFTIEYSDRIKMIFDHAIAAVDIYYGEEDED